MHVLSLITQSFNKIFQTKSTRTPKSSPLMFVIVCLKKQLKKGPELNHESI